VSIELIDDTDTVLAELSSKIVRIRTLEHSIEKRAKTRTESLSEARDNCTWLRKIIKTAQAGRDAGWLESMVGEIESEGFIEEQLVGVPEHIINHALALCKQAIATQTPSLV
jgi:hypothetical protein